MALVFVLALNVLLFLADTAMSDINPDASNIYTADGSMLDGFAKDGDIGNPTLDSSTLLDGLPKSESVVEPDAGFKISDVFGAIRAWMSSTWGVKYLYGIVVAPYNMIALIPFPDGHNYDFIRFGIGAFWYGITFLLMLAFVFGRDA